MSGTPLHCSAYIDGEFRTGGERRERRNPATGEVVATFDVAGRETVDRAVAAAKRAFADWGRTSGFTRGAMFRRLAEITLGRVNELATCVTLEQGKPLDEARGEVRKFAEAMRFYGEEAERIHGETVPNESTDYLSVVVREPVGPVAAITPWNYPVELIGWKLGGAGRGLHDGDQALRAHPRRRAPDRRVHRRGRLPAGRVQRRPRGR